MDLMRAISRPLCRGISTMLLPQRPGNRALDHAITTFNHVRLDRVDLLGELDGAGDKRRSFLSQIHRVSVGGLALSLVNIPATKAGAYLCYTFSKGRTVINPKTAKPTSILAFPTQYGPIISAVAHAIVMESAARFFIGIYQKKGVPEMLRQALVCIFKATITYSTQRHLSDLTDRCGWRGLFAHNKIAEMQLGLKGNSIAEGDVMVLCIRLASELLQGKYTLPPSSTRTSPLARHEQGLMATLGTHLNPNSSSDAPSHRSSLFAQNVTPRAVDLVQAIGHRFAYDSAQDSSISREFVDVWEADCMLHAAGWYIEHAGFTNAELHSRRVAAIERALPYLEGVIRDWGMEKWFGDIPLTSRAAEEEFLRRLPTFERRELRNEIGSML
ncbi:hypothetical protein FB567DRAFT_552213 [Paraphoma chrysanthemicola]|uniref:Acyl-CoA oxidase C-alpha1 domain-containing protein n=1 Tax=Paraphoma chrysanthemicola TaxID=798071 RepID=A0A8K0R1V8_9PLEO|nr:hypothetical protein FB567DRAFT_552213 [Paraphoma chrysanthemicola]